MSDIVELALDLLTLDPAIQPRAVMSVEAIAEYAQAMLDGASFPPVRAYFDGETHWLSQGFHRVLAARRIFRATLAAEVIEGDKRAAMLDAASSNLDHGVRRTNKDKRKQVELLLRDPECARWPDHKIARHCGVSQPFVGTVRAEVALSDNAYQIDETPRLVERNGTIYEMAPRRQVEPGWTDRETGLPIPGLRPAGVAEHAQRAGATSGRHRRSARP